MSQVSCPKSTIFIHLCEGGLHCLCLMLEHSSRAGSRKLPCISPVILPPCQSFSYFNAFACQTYLVNFVHVSQIPLVLVCFIFIPCYLIFPKRVLFLCFFLIRKAIMHLFQWGAGVPCPLRRKHYQPSHPCYPVRTRLQGAQLNWLHYQERSFTWRTLSK